MLGVVPADPRALLDLGHPGVDRLAHLERHEPGRSPASGLENPGGAAIRPARSSNGAARQRGNAARPAPRGLDLGLGRGEGLENLSVAGLMDAMGTAGPFVKSASAPAGPHLAALEHFEEDVGRNGGFGAEDAGLADRAARQHLRRDREGHAGVERAGAESPFQAGAEGSSISARRSTRSPSLRPVRSTRRASQSSGVPGGAVWRPAIASRTCRGETSPTRFSRARNRARPGSGPSR